jgi:Zn-dependent protease
MLHELAHGVVAYKLGDPTAKRMGRLSLNPLKHLDPIGAVCMVLFHFGWAKPVPVDMRYFRKPRRDMAITAIAGPLSNLLLAIVSAFIFLLSTRIAFFFTGMSFAYLCFYYLGMLFYVFHIMNLSLCFFNLFPIPPLDGYRVVSTLLPPKALMWLYRNERKIQMGLFLWLFIGGRVCNALLATSIVQSSAVLTFIIKFLSLSQWLSWLVNSTSDLIINLFQYIPFL